MTIKQPEIHFLTVTQPQTKLLKLCAVAQDHFDKKQPLAFVVADPETARFVDELLWRLPQDSFLPHTVGSDRAAIITILTALPTDPPFPALFNLLPTPLDPKDLFHTIYEWDDQTSPAKQTLSKQRYQSYKEKGLTISNIS
jgi:DNA polymerase III subunit chi